jgi:hypothetical protein
MDGLWHLNLIKTIVNHTVIKTYLQYTQYMKPLLRLKSFLKQLTDCSEVGLNYTESKIAVRIDQRAEIYIIYLLLMTSL